MSDINDGGPAFPAMKYAMLQTGAKRDDYDAAITGQGAKVTHYELTGNGMTLRDYFAAKAMQAMIGCYRETSLGRRNGEDNGDRTDLTTFYRDMAIDSNHTKIDQQDGCDEIAKDAYLFADAMLKARTTP